MADLRCFQEKLKTGSSIIPFISNGYGIRHPANRRAVRQNSRNCGGLLCYLRAAKAHNWLGGHRSIQNACQENKMCGSSSTVARMGSRLPRGKSPSAPPCQANGSTRRCREAAPRNLSQNEALCTITLLCSLGTRLAQWHDGLPNAGTWQRPMQGT